MSTIRPSRNERAPYTDALAESLAEGRLTESLYAERLARAEEADSFAALDSLIDDLPYEPEALRPAAARPRAASRRRTLVKRLAGIVAACAIGFAGGGVAISVVDSGGTASEATFSTAAGRAAKAPGAAPELGTGFTRVEPMAGDSARKAVRFVQSNHLGKVVQISAQGDATYVAVVGSGDSVKEYRLTQDTAPTVDLRPGTHDAIHDTDGATRVDLKKTLKRARKDLGNNSNFNSIVVGTQRRDAQAQHPSDVVVVTFSDSNDAGQNSVIYRLKDMKILEKA